MPEAYDVRIRCVRKEFFMEWTIYTTIVTVISVVVGLAIHHFSIYVIEHGGLRS